MKDFLKLISTTSIEYRISEIIIKLSMKTDLSPKGMIALLMSLYDICKERIPQEMLQPNFLKNLINLLNENQL